MLGFLIEFIFSFLLLSIVLSTHKTTCAHTHTHTHAPASVQFLALLKRREPQAASPQSDVKAILKPNSGKYLTTSYTTISLFVFL